MLASLLLLTALVIAQRTLAVAKPTVVVPGKRSASRDPYVDGPRGTRAF
jgi:hypothetical protein